jgi:hypothetical protein
MMAGIGGGRGSAAVRRVRLAGLRQHDPVAGLGAGFAARPRAFPAAYRSCLIAGIRALAPERISALLAGAIEGRPTINTELNRIAGRCRSAGAR